MPVCDNVKNPREEYLRTKTGYVQQWQTPVEGNSNKEKKRKKRLMQPHKPVTSLDKCRVTIFFKKSNGGNDVYFWYGFT